MKTYYGYLLRDPAFPDQPYSYFKTSKEDVERSLTSMLSRGFELIEKFEVTK